MAMTARGRFEVSVRPIETEEGPSGLALGRMSLDKDFFGDMVGSSKGQMLTAGPNPAGSGAYVAIERFDGSVGGHTGTFVLQHHAAMFDGTYDLNVEIVRGSGTAGLATISGRLLIEIIDTVHHYTLDYDLAPIDAA